MSYVFHPIHQFPFKTLNEAADELAITPQRLSRLLQILSVPVHRKGYAIFLDKDAFNRIEEAIRYNEVRPGRKKKK